jgi:hypothetical protein
MLNSSCLSVLIAVDIGFTTLRDLTTGFRHYAEFSFGDENKYGPPSRLLVPSLYRVGQVDPFTIPGLSSSLSSPRGGRQQQQQQRRRRTLGSPPPDPRPKNNWTGRLYNLVVPILFEDHVNRTLPNQTHLDILFNHVGPHPEYCPTGSIRDVFYENSYGQLELVSTVLDWIVVPYTEQWTANNASGYVLNHYRPRTRWRERVGMRVDALFPPGDS